MTNDLLEVPFKAARLLTRMKDGVSSDSRRRAWGALFDWMMRRDTENRAEETAVQLQRLTYAGKFTCDQKGDLLACIAKMIGDRRAQQEPRFHKAFFESIREQERYGPPLGETWDDESATDTYCRLEDEIKAIELRGAVNWLCEVGERELAMSLRDAPGEFVRRQADLMEWLAERRVA